jgi:hypothetical protein
MTIDLDVNDSQKHRLAVYFLDWDTSGRRSAVEIFDLKTLKITCARTIDQRVSKWKIYGFQLFRTYTDKG